ncbi:hypothetical protein [Nocardiopsis algeriensis]|uniref:Uncharacterized protein n=1 Tax=Nocardiopsis algeriensis TaxID=1478215 RepID=A0A841IJK4_9ACTN|nr:hypothetical protein [Nocardiopsis algeriensis]
MVALVLCATGCTAPALTEGAYRSDALQSATELLSAVRTGVLAAELAEDGKAFTPYLDVTATDAEDTARSVSDTFGTLQPPSPGLDGLRRRITALGDDAVGGLSDLRVAVRRGDRAGTQEAARALRDTARGLADVEESLR